MIKRGDSTTSNKKCVRIKGYERKRMNNYYDACIADIERHIKDGKYEDAKYLLRQELSMPYIPQDVQTKLEELSQIVMVENRSGTNYYDDIYEIENALHGNQQNQIKALLSLERLNIHPNFELLKEWLVSDSFEKWVKQQLLVIMMSQNITEEVTVMMDGETYCLVPSKIESPLEQEAYCECLNELKQVFESENPSMLILCQEVLEAIVWDQFPNQVNNVDANEIIKSVNDYLEQQ